MKRFLKFLLFLVVLAGVAAGGAWMWLQGEVKPVAAGEARYVRFEDGVSLQAALERLEKDGFVRNAEAARYYARLTGIAKPVGSGTYSLRPGLTVEELIAELQKPIRQMVRLPETTWAAQKAKVLEKNEVTPADEYVKLASQPAEFEGVVSFPLPEEHLEGYLYPDTYDLPPLLGAKPTIQRQLRAFEEKVWEGLGKPEDLERAVIIGSMVELEVMKDEERPIVAGVIENRLRLGMRLQIDATILYGLQEWRRLTFDDYRNVDSPYNTYRVDGLPPGPICSPSLKSIEAALNPAEHDFLFYVAMPDGTHIFTRTYAEHLAANRKAKSAFAEQSKGEEVS